MADKSQKDKFKELAREAECEDDEEAFDQKLKRIVKGKTPKNEKTPESKTNRSD